MVGTSTLLDQSERVARLEDWRNVVERDLMALFSSRSDVIFNGHLPNRQPPKRSGT